MTKEIRINVRTSAEIKNDIEIVANLRGITVSSLINMLAREAIREEKEREPSAFVLPSQNKPAIKKQMDESVKVVGRAQEKKPKIKKAA